MNTDIACHKKAKEKYCIDEKYCVEKKYCLERNIVWKRNIVSKRNIAWYQKANKKYCIEEKYCRALKGQGEIFYEWSKKNIVLRTDLRGREWSGKIFVLKRNIVCY